MGVEVAAANFRPDDQPPNNSLERTNPRALAALGRCGLPLSSSVGPHEGR